MEPEEKDSETSQRERETSCRVERKVQVGEHFIWLLKRMQNGRKMKRIKMLPNPNLVGWLAGSVLLLLLLLIWGDSEKGEKRRKMKKEKSAKSKRRQKGPTE